MNDDELTERTFWTNWRVSERTFWATLCTGLVLTMFDRTVTWGDSLIIVAFLRVLLDIAVAFWQRYYKS